MLGIALTVYGLYSHHNENGRTTLLTLGYLALVSILFGTKIVEVPDGVTVPFLGIWPKISDLSKFIVCVVIGLIWAPVARRMVSETVTGLLIVLVPSAVIFLLGVSFLIKSFSRKGN